MAFRMQRLDGEIEEAHDINVTPFIDVALVLPIIFMVAAPLATVDVRVDLPGSTARPQVRPPTPIFLTIKPNKTLALGEQVITEAALPGALDGEAHGDHDQRVYLRADKAIATTAR